MTLLEMLDYLSDEKKARPIIDLGISERTARFVAEGKLDKRQKTNLFKRLEVTSKAEAVAKIAYSIAVFNNLPIDFEYSLDLGTYDDLSCGGINENN